MSCELCGIVPTVGRKGDAMVAMQPGPDGIPWELCLKCWLDGRYPGKLGRIKIVSEEAPKRRAS